MLLLAALLLAAPAPTEVRTFRAALAGLPGPASAEVRVRIARDAGARLHGGTIELDLDLPAAAVAAVEGLHLHAGAATGAPVAIDSGIRGRLLVSGAADRVRLIRERDLGAADRAGLDALALLLDGKASWWLDLHVTAPVRGALRGKLEPASDAASEPPGAGAAPRAAIYRFRATALEPANEPASAWAILRIEPDGTGAPRAASLVFGFEREGPAPARLTALGLRRPSETADPLGAGIDPARPVDLPAGAAGLVRTVTIGSAGPGLAAVAELVQNPGHWLFAAELDGRARTARALAALDFAPLVRSGGGAPSSLLLTNASSEVAAAGIVQFASSDGSRAPQSLPFAIPPGGSLALRAPGGGDPATGYALVRANTPVAAALLCPTPGAPDRAAPTVLARTVSLPVVVDPARGRDVELGVLALPDSGTHLVLAAFDERGAPVPDGSRSLPFEKEKHLAGRLSELVPALAAAAPFRGSLTVERQWASFPAGRMAIVALDRSGAAAAPLALKVVR